MRSLLLWLTLAALAGCGAAPPAPDAAAPGQAATAPDPRPRLRAAALSSARADPSAAAVLPEVWAPGPRRFSAADIERLGALCGEVVDEGLDPQAMGCPAFQRARFLTRPAFDPGAVADRAVLEVRALRLLLGYAQAVRGQFAAARWAATRALPDPDRPQDPAEAALRVRQGVLRRLGQVPVAQIIRGLRPAGDQYVRLMAAARRYRQIVAAGGFKRVPLGHFRRGQRGPGIAALRARLAQEGFTSAPPDGQADRFEQTLFMALGHFQRVHQLAPAARVGRGTRAALRRTAETKLAAVRRALHDWRATARRGPAGLWVQINVADFHGEVWRDGARLHRFRVIVGDDTPDDVGRVRNATPQIHSRIHQIIFNPDWRVPQRILEDEILPRAVERGGYTGLDDLLAAQGFEVVHKGTAAEHVRQRPGRGNPLGRVKFRFPNPYAIYLHDTPRKRLFRRPKRALSHGCVRVERPLHLARLLLEHDNRYDPKAVGRWLAGDEPHGVTLTRPVPIHIDDIGVRVDDEGRAHFLADLYGRRARLRARISPPPPPRGRAAGPRRGPR